jgi:hypothetical protein
MDRLILSRRSGKNVLKPGLRPSSPHRWRLASRRGQTPGPRLYKIFATGQLSRFPRRCDIARTFWGGTSPLARRLQRHTDELWTALGTPCNRNHEVRQL